MAARPPRLFGWIDLLLFLALCAIALPVRFRFTQGDLWLDEADYAVASLHSVHDNLWDLSNTSAEPDSLIRLRHYHAPLTALVLKRTHVYGSDERTLRVPFVLAGGLAVGLVYLCGLALFQERREIAVGCALLVVLTPAHIRMASHAIPWSFIIVELLALLWTLLLYARTKHWGWLVGAGFALGWLFVTSETFFVAIAVVACALPLMLLPELRTALQSGGLIRSAPQSLSPETGPTASPPAYKEVTLTGKRELLYGLVGGSFAALLVALTLWPAGLKGDSIRMLRHYIEMRHSEAFPVNIGSQVYKIAPKWAYLYWYWNDYRPFFLCYAAGCVVILLLLALQAFSRLPGRPFALLKQGTLSQLRQIPVGTGALLLFTLILLIAAHRAHIIGPEYLAHCLPFLTLTAGYVVLLLSRLSRPLGIAAMLAAGFIFVRWTPYRPLPGMDPRTQIPRWHEAAQAIRPLWQSEDRLLLGPQDSNVAYWYLHEWAGIPLHDWQIGQFPLAGPGSHFLSNLGNGKYRFVVVSSQFEDSVLKAVDERSLHILKGWDVVLKSDEHGLGPSRLTVFRYKKAEGVSPQAASTPPEKTPSASYRTAASLHSHHNKQRGDRSVR